MPNKRENMSAEIAAKDRLIVALDVNTCEEALDLVHQLGDEVTFYKVGLQLHMGGESADCIEKLGALGKKVFLDLKMGDIGETIQRALMNTPNAELVELMTLQGPSSIIQAAKSARRDGTDRWPKFLMLTVLSSTGDEDIQALFDDGSAANKEITVSKIVQNRARRALDAGCEGLVASGDSVRRLRFEWFPERDFIIVAPGIRMRGESTDDHKRFLTPFEAIRDGANYLVVGRPIRRSLDKKGTAKEIIADIERGLEERARLMESPPAHKEGIKNPPDSVAH